jgi:hypothetical protein
MTTTVVEHIEALPARWARNGGAVIAALMLLPVLTSKDMDFVSAVKGVVMLVLPVMLIGYCWGEVIRRRFRALRDVSAAETLVASLPRRCAADGAVAAFIFLLGPPILEAGYSGTTGGWLGFHIMAGAIVAVPLGTLFGCFVGATFRETLGYRLNRTE